MTTPTPINAEPVEAPASDAGELVERLDSHMALAKIETVLADCRAAAALIRAQAAELAEAREGMKFAAALFEKGLLNAKEGEIGHVLDLLAKQSAPAARVARPDYAALGLDDPEGRN